MIVYRETLHVEEDGGFMSVHGIGHFEGRAVIMEIPFPLGTTRAEAEMECRSMRGEQANGETLSAGRTERAGIYEEATPDGIPSEVA